MIAASFSTISASEVTDYGVTLGGVSDPFAKAYAAQTNPFAEDDHEGWSSGSSSRPAAPQIEENPFENLGR